MRTYSREVIANNDRDPKEAIATTNQTVVRVSLTRTAPHLKIRESNSRIFAQEKFFRFSRYVGRLFRSDNVNCQQPH